jgi:lipid-binding SYLF domain-containing protein
MKRKGSNFGMLVMTVIALLALLATGMPRVNADEKADAQGIVDKAKVTLDAFLGDQNYVWINENLKNARGILIYPQILKAGFILGGSGGSGVFLANDQETGEWSQPAFYTVGSVTFGLQIGGEAAETVILAMTQKAVDSLYTSSVKLGADTSFALGPVGTGAKANVTADFIAFSMSKGAYAGLNLEGSVVGVRESLNKAYYGEEVTPVQIIVEKKVSNKGSSELRAALKKGVSKPVTAEAQSESRWASADLGGPSAAGAQSRWDTADLGGPSASRAQSRWDTADLGGPSASRAQSRWDTADLGGPSASKAQSRWDTADLGGPSAAPAQPQGQIGAVVISLYDTNGNLLARWNAADQGGPSASRAQSRWDTADLGGPSASRAQSRWDTADLGGPSASRAQSRWDTADLGGPSAAGGQSRWDSADLGGPSATGSQKPIEPGIWDKQYRVWKRTPRVEIVNKNYSRDQVGNAVVDIIDKEGLKFYFQDFTYIPVRFEWLEQYVLWWKEAMANFGIAYANDAFDCENFARLFKAMLDVQILPMELKESKSLASATVLVYPKNEFGGVGPESGTHVLNLVGTDRGWIIVEPQTGAMVELSKYPNLKHIIGLGFG